MNQLQYEYEYEYKYKNCNLRLKFKFEEKKPIQIKYNTSLINSYLKRYVRSLNSI